MRELSLIIGEFQYMEWGDHLPRFALRKRLLPALLSLAILPILPILATAPAHAASSPTFSSVSPTSGPLAGGTAITIAGAHLGATGTTTVTIGGISATSVVVAGNQNSLTAVTPSLSTVGAKDIVINSGVGT